MLVKSLYRFRRRGRGAPTRPELHGRSAIFDLLAYAGPSGAGETLLTPFCRLGPPIATCFGQCCTQDLPQEGEGCTAEAHSGPTWDRPNGLKSRYDLTNLFHVNQTITPVLP
ncbi:MAG: hypothetical protein HW375_571 [Anaerolineales bacterium]|nr:hypothetical protein [Anaerolineales bacterium]